MTASVMTANDGLFVGDVRGVQVAVAPRDAATADVDIAVAGMFSHERGADGPAGGLLHLDTAMGGAATRLRSDGIFRAAPGELLALSPVVPPVRASTVLLVGMGDPADWEPAILHLALSAAAAEVRRRDAASASFAPSLLDSGIPAVDWDAAATQMLGGLADGLAASPGTGLEWWIFCAGPAHIASTRAAFAKAFAVRPAP